MQGSKIGLSSAEIELLTNGEIILTKNSIQQKMVALLSQTAQTLQQYNTLYPEAHSTPPKISKGENYSGLPYVVLDYPRITSGNNLLFVRSFFWWGNFYSSTLQLAGDYKTKHLSGIAESWQVLADKKYFVGIHPNPWQHHFEKDNYQEIAEVNGPEFNQILHQQAHIKIAARWPLQTWDAAATNLENSWLMLMQLIS